MIAKVYHVLVIVGGVVFVAILSYYLNFPVDIKTIIAYFRSKA